jgi:hypothetical protein
VSISNSIVLNSLTSFTSSSVGMKPTYVIRIVSPPGPRAVCAALNCAAHSIYEKPSGLSIVQMPHFSG